MRGISGAISTSNLARKGKERKGSSPAVSSRASLWAISGARALSGAALSAIAKMYYTGPRLGQATLSCSDSASQMEQEGSSACASQTQPSASPNGAKAQLTALLHAEATDLPQNLGELLSAALTSQSPESAAEAVTVAVEGFRQTGALPEAQKLQALQASIALRTRLQGFLQAQTQKRCSIGRRGALHPGSLHRLQTGNPRIFRREAEQVGLNTAVHILLDVSGSMCGVPIALAKLACYAVAKALENIRGVNPAATAFPALASSSSVFPIMRHGQKAPGSFDISASGGR